MKRLLIVATFVLVAAAFAAPASADWVCFSYYDTWATGQWGTTYCSDRGALCYNCADTQTGDNCSSNWTPCAPKQPAPQPLFKLADCSIPAAAAPRPVAERSRADRAAALKPGQLL